MADDKTDAVAGASTKRAPGERGTAGAADKAPPQRLEPSRRALSRTELERLRSRLQKKFH